MTRILIVEDEVLIGMALDLALKAEGYETRHVTDGQKAVAALDDFRPDVIVTDYMMPRMDGAALIEAIRNMPEAKGMHIILMSAIPEETINTKKLGYDAFLQKAFRYAVLREMLERVLKKGAAPPPKGRPGKG